VIESTTVLFGLPGVQVTRVSGMDEGTRIVEIATDEATAAACPSCGVFSTSVKACVHTTPKDIPYGEGRILLRWNKTRWRCREDYCERGSFTEAIEAVPRRARTTGRLRTQIGAAIGDAARSVTEVAAAHEVSWPTAHRAFVEHAQRLLTEPAPVRVLGIDETRRGKPRWEHSQGHQPVGAGRSVGHRVRRPVEQSGTSGAEGGADHCGGGDLVDRTHPGVPGGDRLRRHRSGRGVCGGGPHSGPAAQRHRGGRSFSLGCAREPGCDQDSAAGHLGTEGPPRRQGRPRMGKPTQTAHRSGTTVDKNVAKMWNTILDEDPSAQILSAYIAKEELRTLLSTVRLGGDPHLTRHRLHRFQAWCIDSNIPELIALAKTVDAWWPEINAFVLTGITNARTEGYNRLVKAVKRSACGFRNRENSARRIRFHCTRTQRAATQTSC